ncbi:NaeI family type II restriction endonuclease [Actinoplanes sp. Pm04-4]|uniref:NaeI family type II restriction endonuclease n=1 Tax=Paractinoplanes pyxinae TaxID=2997416 RepID=A0ABT4B7I3_9ACTN|nr:NaeI family type II restriction endonuclease [Actinoplanes pyxinae]MCY1142472.1 NaeI family type II restriction endonuclease [Actinoplanes pyxinae]
MEISSDDDVQVVKEELERRAGGANALTERIGNVLRRSLDRSYEGLTTGRFHLAQLSKTEKAHTGSLFEVELQKEFDLADGHQTDYQILGMDVDAKYTHSRKGSSPSWMIGPEIEGSIALIATADDYQSVWSAWLVWITPGRRNAGANRDSKASLNDAGKEARVSIAVDAPLPANTLLQRPGDAYEVMKFQGPMDGQKRILELCRRFEGILLSRTTVVTVAKQLDGPKRMRENGGARTRLANDGYIIIGNEARYDRVIRALKLQQPAKGEFIPLKVVRAHPEDAEPFFLDSDGTEWRRARPSEPGSGIPKLASS